MGMDEFYLTLMSGGEPNNFVYNLPSTVHLDGTWDVALVDFYAPQENNIDGNGIIAWMKGGKLQQYAIPKGYYRNFGQMKSVLLRNKVPLTLTQGSGVVKMVLGSSVSRITFLGSIATVFGFRENTIMTQSSVNDELNFDLHRSIKTTFVECNFIQSQIVNSARRPVLASFTTSPQGEYRRVIRRELGQLKFQIKDQYDNLIPYNSGETLLKLHFKHGAGS